MADGTDIVDRHPIVTGLEKMAGAALTRALTRVFFVAAAALTTAVLQAHGVPVPSYHGHHHLAGALVSLLTPTNG